MTTEILIEVRDRLPVVRTCVDLITHNSDYYIRFVFDDEWNEYPHKTVYFVYEDGSYTPVIMSGDTCSFPMVQNERRRVFIGVQGGNLKTTRACHINVYDSIADMLNQQIPSPSEDVYAQIMSIINNLEAAKLNPVEKTDDMTQPVGRDESGRLYTYPSGGGGSGLPTITEEDEGRVLTASGGVAVWRELPKYTGEYSVTPSADSAQTLETAQKYMGGNVTVEKIPYYEMDNPSGGTTIYIGSDGEIITE
ncbi:MAG: hypothetical protein ACI3ZQ_05725 [Candidatus Cryptobacteroides sp.]